MLDPTFLFFDFLNTSPFQNGFLMDSLFLFVSLFSEEHLQLLKAKVSQLEAEATERRLRAAEAGKRPAWERVDMVGLREYLKARNVSKTNQMLLRGSL